MYLNRGSSDLTTAHAPSRPRPKDAGKSPIERYGHMDTVTQATTTGAPRRRRTFPASIVPPRGSRTNQSSKQPYHAVHQATGVGFARGICCPNPAPRPGCHGHARTASREDSNRGSVGVRWPGAGAPPTCVLCFPNPTPGSTTSPSRRRRPPVLAPAARPRCVTPHQSSCMHRGEN